MIHAFLNCVCPCVQLCVQDVQCSYIQRHCMQSELQVKHKRKKQFWFNLLVLEFVFVMHKQTRLKIHRLHIIHE